MNGLNAWIAAVIVPAGGNDVVATDIFVLAESDEGDTVIVVPPVKADVEELMAVPLANTVAAEPMVPPRVKFEVLVLIWPFEVNVGPLTLMLPVLLMVAEPDAPGPVIVIWVPEREAVNPVVPVALLICVVMFVAIVVVLLLLPVAAAMMGVPFTVIWVTFVVPLPDTVIVVVPVPTSLTTGAKPAADAGPVMVTVLPDEVAPKPAAVMAAATLAATVLELLARLAPLLMICVPFTVMPFTCVAWLPENVRVVLAVPTFDTTGVAPTAAAGPTTVTTAPDDVAL